LLFLLPSANVKKTMSTESLVIAKTISVSGSSGNRVLLGKGLKFRRSAWQPASFPQLFFLF